MGYHVEVEHRAARTLEKMSRGDRAGARRVTQAIKGLKEDPRPANATKLVGADAWRLRVGGYRVLYVIDDTVRVVTVTKLGPRENFYG